MTADKYKACEVCGKPKSEHHRFVPPVPRLDGCVCKVVDGWLSYKPVCDRFIADPTGDGTLCAVCEHGKGCHNDE